MAAYSSVEVRSHGEPVLLLRCQYLADVGLHLVGLCVFCQSQPVGDPLEMGVHYDSRLAEYSAHHHIGSLAPYAWQLDQLLYSVWNSSVIKLQELLGCSLYVLGLGMEETGGMNQLLKDRDICLGHLFRGWETGKQGRDNPHHLLVGGLGAQYHSNQKLEVVPEVEKLNILRVVSIQDICDLGSFCFNSHTKIKYHLYLDRVKLNPYTKFCIGMWPSG